MSLFGSRKEDPLLQNDPFAPSSEEDKSTESSSEDDPPENNPDRDETSQREQEAEESESPSSSTAGESKDSVFTPSRTQEEEGKGFFQFGSRGDSRVIVRSAKEAEEGRLTVINSAIDEGWRLDRVETSEEAPTQGTASEKMENEERSQFKLAFIFRRPGR